MEPKDFNRVRSSIKQQCGSEVIIYLDKGRNKIDVKKGVIQDAYASVFTIRTRSSEDVPEQSLSFSYSDVITKDIRMVLC